MSGVSLISAPEDRACPPVETALQEQMQTEELQMLLEQAVRPCLSIPSASAKKIQNPFRHIDSDQACLKDIEQTLVSPSRQAH